MAHHPTSPLYAPTLAGRKARVETHAELVKRDGSKWVGRGGTAKGGEDRMAKWLAAGNDPEARAALEKRWHEEDTVAAAADEERKAKQAESAAAFEQAKASIAGLRSKRPRK